VVQHWAIALSAAFWPLPSGLPAGADPLPCREVVLVCCRVRRGWAAGSVDSEADGGRRHRGLQGTRQVIGTLPGPAAPTASQGCSRRRLLGRQLRVNAWGPHGCPGCPAGLLQACYALGGTLGKGWQPTQPGATLHSSVCALVLLITQGADPRRHALLRVHTVAVPAPNKVPTVHAG
jgi:hypothetical protein